MFATHPPKDSDVKYARGGVVDVEFIVQYPDFGVCQTNCRSC